MKILYIVFLISIYSQLINAFEITIKYRDGSSKIEQYDESIEKLSFIYGRGRNIVDIAGLEQFKNLKELWLGMTSQINNYSFLKHLDNIEILVFQDINFKNIDFLYDMVSLRKLIFQSCRIVGKIDASRLPHLEYFEFTNSSLTEFPIKICNQNKLDIINVAFNNIHNIPNVEYLKVLILAVSNPININNKNVITGDVNDYFFLVPEKYRQYIR